MPAITIKGIRLDLANSKIGKGKIEIDLNPNEVRFLEKAFHKSLPRIKSEEMAGKLEENAFRAAIKRLCDKLAPLRIDISGAEQRGYHLRFLEGAAAKPVIKVGLWTFGSPLSDLNEPITQAFRNTFKKLENGDLNFTTEVIPRDETEWTAEAVDTGLQWFAEQDVVAVVGPMDSKAAYQVLAQKALDRHKLCMLSPSASSAALCHGKRFHRLFFRCRNSDRPLLQELRRWIQLEHRGAEIQPLVQSGSLEAPSFGDQNWEVFSLLDGDNVMLEAFTYPEGKGRDRALAWAETVRQKQPKVIVAFGFGAELAPLCHHARAEKDDVVIYTIDPRRECFLNPALSDPTIKASPIIGLRAVVESTFQVGGGSSTRIYSFRKSWEATCVPKRRWAYRNSLCGHDTAHILAAALVRIVGEGNRSTTKIRKALPVELQKGIVLEETLLTSGVFSKQNELFAPVRCVHLTTNNAFEDVWPPEPEVTAAKLPAGTFAGPG